MEKNTITHDGFYQFGFSDLELGNWEIHLWSQELIPEYMIANSKKFAVDAGDSLKINLKCYTADTVIYGVITITRFILLFTSFKP